MALLPTFMVFYIRRVIKISISMYMKKNTLNM